MSHLVPFSSIVWAQNLSGEKRNLSDCLHLPLTHGASGVVGRPGRRAAARVTSSC